uniref:Carbonic anhydrase-like protein n=1 Tax=Mytilus edulis TaxID=6550 RepID=A0A3S5X262_MYTED|nr:carbonic anhydrase-like protein [Mytilus edulis]
MLSERHLECICYIASIFHNISWTSFVVLEEHIIQDQKILSTTIEIHNH